jgi:hypothetical protein
LILDVLHARLGLRVRVKQHGALLAAAVAALALAALQGCSSGGDEPEAAPIAPVEELPAESGSCDAGYVYADLPWGEKCLVHGELCKQAEDAAYHEYGFHCHEDARLRRE